MRKTCFAVTGCLCLAAGGADAKTWVIVLPESFAGAKDALMQQIGETASHLGSGPDDRLLIYDGVTIQQIGAVTQPTGPKTQNRAWVRNQLAAQLASVSDFVRAMPTTSKDGGPVSAVNFPGILDEIGRNIVPSLPEKKADVMVLGSFLYYDSRNLVFSMRNGFYPLDADLKARESEIPYGIADLGKRLQGTTVHICGANGSAEFVTPEYEKSVQRFWGLFIAGQGGRVGTMSYDLPTCFARLQSDQASGQLAYTLSGDSRVGMIRYSMVGDMPAASPVSAPDDPKPDLRPAALHGNRPLVFGRGGMGVARTEGEASSPASVPQRGPSAGSSAEVVPFSLGH